MLSIICFKLCTVPLKSNRSDDQSIATMIRTTNSISQLGIAVRIAGKPDMLLYCIATFCIHVILVPVLLLAWAASVAVCNQNHYA